MGVSLPSESFLKALNVLWINQIITSFNKPKGNADTERFMRTIEEELLLLNEFTSFEEAKGAMAGEFVEPLRSGFSGIMPTTRIRRFSYLSPEEFERRYRAQHVAFAV